MKNQFVCFHLASCDIFPISLDNAADVPSNTKHFETPADLMLRLHPPSDRNAPGAVNNIHNKAPQVERHVVGGAFMHQCITNPRILNDIDCYIYIL